MSYGTFLYEIFLMLWFLAAGRDLRERKVSKILVYFILVNGLLIFGWNIDRYTMTDIYLIVVNLIITVGLVWLKKMGKADIILVTLPVAFPFYGTVALVLFGIVTGAVFVFFRHSEEMTGRKFVTPSIPVITAVLVLFLYVYVTWNLDVPQSVCDEVGDTDCNLIIDTQVIENENVVNGGGIEYPLEPNSQPYGV